jgi:tetratricopeptide (TPR) repeat protein
LAEAYRLQRNYPESLDYAQRAVNMNLNNAGNRVELGDVYSSCGRYGEANAAYKRAAATQEEALDTSPGNGPGWMLLAFCRAKTGQAQAALDLIDKAESLHADDMDSQLLKIRTQELAGMRDDALNTIQRCLGRSDRESLFQIKSMPDLDRLRASQKYESMVASIQPTAP